jgi:hypothetical protein
MERFISENWIPMLRQDDSGPYSLMTNTRFRDQGSVPDATWPAAICANVTFQHPGEHGMGETSEMNAIDRVIDGLAPQILAEASGVYVGRVRGQGRARLWFYAPSSAQHTIERLVRVAFRARTVEVVAQQDPEWSTYVAMLPTEDEEQHTMDRMVINQLEQHGDPLTVARDVQHFAYFADEVSAQRYAVALKALRFHVTVEPSVEPSPSAEICVIANRDDPATPEAIMPITSRLLALAKEHGGTYDGWEAKLMKTRGGLAGLVARLMGRG